MKMFKVWFHNNNLNQKDSLTLSGKDWKEALENFRIIYSEKHARVLYIVAA